MLLDKIKIDYKVQIIYVFTPVFRIHVQNWNLSQNQNKSLSCIFIQELQSLISVFSIW